MKNLHRERRLDPAEWGFPEIGPLPQDCTNNRLEPPSLLTPVVHLSSGRRAKETRYEITSQATSTGVRLGYSRTGQVVVMVAYHGLLFLKEVYTIEEDGVRGDVVNARPELYVVSMKLTASESHNFTNSVYFQAEYLLSLFSRMKLRKNHGLKWMI